MWVVVTHIVSPNDFYVRYIAERRESEVLSKKINQYCWRDSCRFVLDDMLEMGEDFFFPFKNIKMLHLQSWDAHSAWNYVLLLYFDLAAPIKAPWSLQSGPQACGAELPLWNWSNTNAQSLWSSAGSTVWSISRSSSLTMDSREASAYWGEQGQVFDDGSHKCHSSLFF